MALPVVEKLGKITEAKETANKFSIVMFSGTVDKFIPLGVMSQAAAAMGMEVNVFVTGFALMAFTKEHHDLPFPAEFAAMAPAMQGMQEHNVAPLGRHAAPGQGDGCKGLCLLDDVRGDGAEA